MEKYHDLAFQINGQPNCTFYTGDTLPKLSFTESFENNLPVINTKIDNLRMDATTHLLRPGCIPDQNIKPDLNDTWLKTYYSISRYIGKTLILDISPLFDPIRKYFTEEGVLKIAIEDTDNYNLLFDGLDNLTLTKQIFLNALEKNQLSIDGLQGLCFYTGLSKFWQYQKFEAWESLFFLGLELSQDFVQFVLENSFCFLGIDSLRFGHTFLNFSGLERIFVPNKQCKILFNKRLEQLKQTKTKYKLLKNNVVLYQSLNINNALANEVGEFIGLPLPINMEGFDNISLTRPVFKL